MARPECIFCLSSWVLGIGQFRMSMGWRFNRGTGDLARDDPIPAFLVPTVKTDQPTKSDAVHGLALDGSGMARAVPQPLGRL
jgi:hypothetical protein